MHEDWKFPAGKIIKLLFFFFADFPANHVWLPAFQVCKWGYNVESCWIHKHEMGMSQQLITSSRGPGGILEVRQWIDSYSITILYPTQMLFPGHLTLTRSSLSVGLSFGVSRTPWKGWEVLRFPTPCTSYGNRWWQIGWEPLCKSRCHPGYYSKFVWFVLIWWYLHF